MQQNKGSPIRKAKWFAPALIAMLIVVLIAGGVLAAVALTSTTLPASGKITVPTSPAPTTTSTATTTTTTSTATGDPVSPGYTISSDMGGASLLTSSTPIDFSCTAADCNGDFSRNVTIYIENTGTDGTGSYAGDLATISKLPVTFNYTSVEGDNLTCAVTYGTPAGIDTEVAGTSPTFIALRTGEAEAITITLTGTVTPNTSDTTELLETLPTFSFTFSPS